MSEDSRVLLDLEYARMGERSLFLDLYLPESEGKPVPAIVWIHGGAWKMGSKSTSPTLPFVRDAANSRGFAFASIDYRLSQDAIFPAQIHDCKAAVRWLRANAGEYGIDPELIGAWGPSAGGHLSALLGTSGGVEELEGEGNYPGYSSRVEAVCDWFGPSDLTYVNAGDHQGAIPAPDSVDSARSQLLGGLLSERLDLARLASPIAFVSADCPPFLIMHGDQDPSVPIYQSQMLYDALKNAGVDVEFHTVPGAGHGGPEFQVPEVVGRAVDFFARTLLSAKAVAV